MKIHFVNHASVIVESCGHRIAFDPWIEGRIFNEGWDLLCETAMTYDDFGTLSHVWFSHEHPDHFNPPNLREIPEEIRARLPVLYRPTKDGRVADFCRNLGFAAVEELATAVWHDLGGGLRMMCAPYGEDSWIALDDGERRLLNVNDCEIANRAHMQSIRDLVGPVDLLLTQFSYASWSGIDVAARRAAARKILERVAMQADVSEAKYVLPFASFVWFCQADNAFLNDGMNQIDEVARFIEEETDASPVVMYPEDEWEVGAPWDGSEAIRRYGERYAAVAKKLGEAPPPPACSLEELQEAARTFCEQNLEASNRLLLRGYLAKMNADSRARMRGEEHASPLSALSLSVKIPTVWVIDLETAFELSVTFGLRETTTPRQACDLELSSDSLRYAFQLPWGAETLEINGRYMPRSLDARYAFFDQFRPVRRLNHGYAPLKLTSLARRAASKLLARG